MILTQSISLVRQMLIQQNSSMIKLVPATSNVKQANLLSNISFDVYLTWSFKKIRFFSLLTFCNIKTFYT